MDNVITLLELKSELERVKEKIWKSAEKVGHEPQLIIHWTGGNYNSVYDDYHICVTGYGVVHYMRTLERPPIAQYMHNTGTIAVSLCCAYNATPEKLGNYKPTSTQIEIVSKIVALFAKAIGVPIDKTHVLTHGEVADNEDGTNYCAPYGPKSTCEKWDLEYLGTNESPIFDPYHHYGYQRGGDVFRGKGIFYSFQKNII